MTSPDGYGSPGKKSQEELESSRKEDFQGKSVKIKCICVKESWGKDKVIFFKYVKGSWEEERIILFVFFNGVRNVYIKAQQGNIRIN